MAILLAKWPVQLETTRRYWGEGVADTSTTLTRLGVLTSACSKVHGYARLVANGPGVVTRLRKKDIARTDFALSAIIHTDAHAPGQNVASVGRLAGVCLGQWLDVLRPAPPRLKRAAQDGRPTYVDYRGLPLGRKGPCLVGPVQALDFHARHRITPPDGPSVLSRH